MRSLRSLIKKARRGFQNKRARAHGLVPVHPCYYVRPSLNANSVVLDCGLGNDADFSQAIIREFKSFCYGADPTRKHAESLKEVSSQLDGRFQFFPVAVAGQTGQLTFFESRENVSGSAFATHANVVKDDCITYTVPALTIGDLIRHWNLARVDLLKLDIEGAEYDVLDVLLNQPLEIPQLIVEFHHECVETIGRARTDAMIEKFRQLQYQVFSADSRNYSFYHSTLC